MPWLVEDISLPAAAMPLSAGTAGVCCHCYGQHSCWRAAVCFVSPCLPFVFVYQGITGMTLQSSTMPFGENGHRSTVHKPNKEQAAGPSSGAQAGKLLPHLGEGEKWELKRHQACKWGCCKSVWLTLPVWLTSFLDKLCQNKDKMSLSRQQTTARAEHSGVHHSFNTAF